MVHVESMIQEDAAVCTRSAEHSLAFMRRATRAAEAQELLCVPHRGATRGLHDRQKSGIINIFNGTGSSEALCPSMLQP